MLFDRFNVFFSSFDRQVSSPKDLVNAFQHRAGAVNAPHAGHAPAPCAAQARMWKSNGIFNGKNG